MRLSFIKNVERTVYLLLNSVVIPVGATVDIARSFQILQKDILGLPPLFTLLYGRRLRCASAVVFRDPTATMIHGVRHIRHLLLWKRCCVMQFWKKTLLRQYYRLGAHLFSSHWPSSAELRPGQIRNILHIPKFQQDSSYCSESAVWKLSMAFRDFWWPLHAQIMCSSLNAL